MRFRASGLLVFRLFGVAGVQVWSIGFRVLGLALGS